MALLSENTKRYALKAAAYGLLAYFSYLMLLITLQYVPADDDTAFLRIKNTEIGMLHYRLSFFAHVYSSIFVLLAGLTQFSDSVRRKLPRLHRRSGMVYVSLILFVAAPSGFVMGIYANGGAWSQIAFVLLAVLWFWFSYKAYRFALQKKWELHQNYMLRSYALTLSAISLRLFKWGIVYCFAPPPMDTYRIVAWAGWGINLLIVEAYLFWKKA